MTVKKEKLDLSKTSIENCKKISRNSSREIEENWV